MRRHALCAIIMLLAGLLVTEGWASDGRGDAEAVLRVAQGAYDRGVELKRSDPAASRQAFEEAATAFAEALDLVGPNGDLWFNLGNTHLQLGQVGPAIHAFRNAELLLGATPRVVASLTYARSLRQDQIPQQGGQAMLRQVLDARMLLSPSLRLTLALAINALFWALVGVRLFRPVPWTALVAAGLVAGVLAASVALDHRDWRAADAGVLLRDEVVLRTGNGESFGTAINDKLGSGVEIRIREARPGWLRIELPDGKEGWVREEMVGRVGTQ